MPGGTTTDELVDDVFQGRDFNPVEQQLVNQFITEELGGNGGQFASRDELLNAFADYVDHPDQEYYNGEVYDADIPFDDIQYMLDELNFAGTFDGIDVIEEKDTEYVFIPSSDYCGLKTICKWGDYVYDTKGFSPFTCNMKKLLTWYTEDMIREDGESNIKFNKRKSEYFYNHIPNIYFTKYGSGELHKFPKSTNTTDEGKIILTKFKKFIHMAYLKPAAKNLKKKELIEAMTVTTSKRTDLLIDFKKLDKYTPKEKFADWIVAYDIEAVPIDKVFIPISIQAQFINLRTKTSLPYAFFYNGPENINRSILYDALLDWIENNAIELKISHVQVFAHNGSRFDNPYVKNCKGVKFVSEIKMGTQLKQLVLKKNAITIEFKDSMAYTVSSLAKSCEYLKVDEKFCKKDFDIRMNLEDYRKEHIVYERMLYNKSISANPKLIERYHTPEWMIYAEYDVHALREVLFAIEEHFMALGESITAHLGIPSIAWNLLMKSCDIMRHDIYVPKDPTMIKFIREAMYGGRVQAYKRHFNDPNDYLIAVDANSLYPSVMAKCDYPVGKPRLIPKDFEPGNKLYIAECTVQIPNIPNAYCPHRTEDRRVIYPSNQTVKGVWCSVDIDEMKEQGYKVEIHKGIYWVRKSKIFTDFIESLYDLRKVYKKDNNGMEYVIKIILNSSYGKLLEMIDKKNSFYTPKEGEDVNNKIKIDNLIKTRTITDAALLNNGQYEFTYDIGYGDCTKPCQLGVFVLAYARAFMNKYIREIGMENIYYTDTDSIYLTGSRYKELMNTSKNFQKLIGKDLCQGKNDYGDDQYIKSAIFLDQKRYFLEFQDETGAAKFNGYKFEYEKKITDKYYCKDDTRLCKQFYIDLEKNYETYNDDQTKEIEKCKKWQTVWGRTNASVSIDTKEIGYTIQPSSKSFYKDNIYYSLGYDLNSPKEIIVNSVKEIISEFTAQNYTVHKFNSELCAVDKIANMTQVYSVRVLHTPKLIIKDFKDGKFQLPLDQRNVKTGFYLLPNKNGNFTIESRQYTIIAELDKKFYRVCSSNMISPIQIDITKIQPFMYTLIGKPLTEKGEIKNIVHPSQHKFLSEL